MSARRRTSKHPKGYGYDFQGRYRYSTGSNIGYGRFAKTVSHRVERRAADRECYREKTNQGAA